ncbi:hypothetical protein [Mycoplasma seminis]|uniref:Uncharacterized protein n=1 Tax=Mycoplasma seminis TaxID=512749 RepID=A0ABY9H9J5_9MOLU|nr:hypothetical protein [Mycoplasma seminis]WLP85250.1 hypothetical protein Q8852_02920 [Mycoplasma seminis]
MYKRTLDKELFHSSLSAFNNLVDRTKLLNAQDFKDIQEEIIYNNTIHINDSKLRFTVKFSLVEEK